MSDERQVTHPQRSAASVLYAVLAVALLLTSDLPAATKSHQHGKAEHVVLVVWDGMRPDFITEAYSPTLWKLAHAGVTFRNHHSVYPSLTSVNATVLATGVYPSRSGLIANYEYRAALDATKPVRTDAEPTVRKGDEVSGGKYLAVPTIADLVQAKGGRCAMTGTKTAPLLQQRSLTAASRSVTLFAGTTIPPTALAEIVKSIGVFPAADNVPNAAEDAWTTRALTESLWKEGVPQYSVLWMSEPDRSQHATAPGSEAAIAGIKSSDANLDMLLRALDEKGARQTTDIFIVSDHGFSTIERTVDVAKLMRSDGFSVVAEGNSALSRGDVRIVGNGGTNFFYVAEHDEPTTRRLVEWLQHSDFAGVIFSGQRIEGTFPISDVHVDSPLAPDVVMGFRWNGSRNQFGVTGMIASNGTVESNKGTHGTLGPFDLHNTFIAVGPDFERGLGSDLATSNLDVAATILNVLGLTPPQPLDGRVVVEGMTKTHRALRGAETKTREVKQDFPTGTWRQYLRTSKVGATVYVDEGNGQFEPKQ